MPVEVMVRISPRMFLEDFVALRDWLEQTYPVGWAERADEGHGDALTAGEFVLVAVFTGVGEAVGKVVIDLVREKIKELAGRYPGNEPPPAEATACARPEDTEPVVGDTLPPGEPGHDAH